MDEHRDEVDTWLSERVQPLLPPPGRFEAIRREARRRRTRRISVVAASAAVVVVAAAALVPHLAGLTRGGGQPAPVTAPSAPHVTTPPAKPSGTAVPPGFAPTSVTFVGTHTGWLLGHSATPGECGPAATTTCLLRTDNKGRTWRRVNPPPVDGPDGPSGVSQVRFLNTAVGWAFGPQLWATGNGGQTWTEVPTHGMRVTALETRNDRAFAVWAHCTGSGPLYAANCHSFAVYSAPTGTNTWTQVAGAGVQQVPGGGAGSAQLVLTSARAYLLPPDGILSAGVLTAGLASSIVSWQPVPGGSVPCTPGPAQPDGQPSLAMLAANGTGLLLLCHYPPSAHQPTDLFALPSSGGTWTLVGQVPQLGTPTSVSGTPSGATVVVTTTQGIEISSDGGVTWTTARGASVPGGFAYAGMTTDQQGVALPADAAHEHAVWLSYDAGALWRRYLLG